VGPDVKHVLLQRVKIEVLVGHFGAATATHELYVRLCDLHKLYAPEYLEVPGSPDYKCEAMYAYDATLRYEYALIGVWISKHDNKIGPLQLCADRIHAATNKDNEGLATKKELNDE